MPKPKPVTLAITPNPAPFDEQYTVTGEGLEPNKHVGIIIQSPAIRATTVGNVDANGRLQFTWRTPDTGQVRFTVTDPLLRNPEKSPLATGICDMLPAG